MDGYTGRAFARAALAGNPSDGYGGRTVAACVADWWAEAHLRPGGRLRIEGVTAAAPLAHAALARLPSLGVPALRSGTITLRTSIPRQVGLGGSSAIVIAVLRAVVREGLDEAPDALAREALAAEVEELGIAAGPQDRVVQAHGGLLDMDFGSGRVAALDPRSLPPLLLAHRRTPARPSGHSHDELKARFERGDPATLAALRELATAAERAAHALRTGDADGLGEALDESFDARARIVDLDPDEAEGAWIARRHGAAVNYAGSGGAVVVLCDDGAEPKLVEAYRRAGWEARRLRVAGARADA
jgi:glucuronokinase